MKKILVFCFFFYGILSFSTMLYAVDTPTELLTNPQQEQTAESIGQQLRCLVCQNESIEESSAPLAQDLRHIIRIQITQGKTKSEIITWMTQHYGNFIRFKPVFNTETALLWFMPFLALGGAFMLASRLWVRHPYQHNTPSQKD